MQPVHVQASRIVAIGIEDAYDRTLAMPLPELFAQRHVMLPPIAEVWDAPEVWGEPGQTRRIRTTDGGTLHETLTACERPTHFTYRIDEIRGPMKPLVRTIDGAWRFVPSGTGTEVSWEWTLHPTSRVTRPTVQLVGRFWNGYAAKALAVLDAHLARS